MTITAGDGADLGHGVPEGFRKLDAQQSSDMFEDEHGRKMDFQVVDDVPDDSAPWICKRLSVCRVSRMADTENLRRKGRKLGLLLRLES